MKFSVATATLILSLSAVNALELTPDNFDAETAGKTVFLKFFAPWCRFSINFKPDWDILKGKFKDSPSALFAEVDCTTEGKALCDANGVRGYPTLKYGDPNNLEDYQGSRDLETLTKFAEENLKPSCGPANIDLCDDEKKAEIKKLQDMAPADLEKLIAEKEAAMEEAEKSFKDEVSKLQDTYQKLSSDLDAALEEIKNSGLGLMKAVKAAAGSAGNDEL